MYVYVPGVNLLNNIPTHQHFRDRDGKAGKKLDFLFSNQVFNVIWLLANLSQLLRNNIFSEIPQACQRLT